MCGATSGQQQIAQEQTSQYQTMIDQAKQVFGSSSSVFQDLISSFSPLVAAGPNQEGFSAGEKSNLDSSAITQTGQAFKNANQAVKESEAAVGGGNIALTSGTEIGKDLSVANSAAAQTASELNQINEADYATGRQNFFKAATDLNAAPGVFNPATSASSAATSSGEAAASTENQIAQENNSWVGAVTGALAGIAGSAISGFMSKTPGVTTLTPVPPSSGLGGVQWGE